MTELGDLRFRYSGSGNGCREISGNEERLKVPRWTWEAMLLNLKLEGNNNNRV
jgi:hypothetical protein